MARLPTSGQLSLNNVRSTFSLTGALAMNTLYKGTGIIPNTPQHSTVPTSGAITLSNLYGADALTFTMTPDTQTLDEGGANDGADPSSQTFTVAATGFSAGTTGTMYWTIEDASSGAGTAATTADFAAVSGSFACDGNSGTFTINVQTDNATEGDETWYVLLREGSITGTVRDFSTITVKDTSISASYGLSGPATIAENGSTNNYTISAPGVPDATTLYWTIGTTAAGGTAATTADFNAVSGSVTIASNAGTIPVVAKADTLTEGVETWFLQLRTGSVSGTIVANSSFTVTDDSLSTPTYAIGGSATIAENGTAQAYPITTTNVVDGTTLYWTVNTTTADMTAVSGSFVVNSNSGSLNLTAIADNLTEGSENITLSVRTGSIAGTVVATKAITITDTSTATPTIVSVTGPGSVNEGSAATINVVTSDIADATVLNWSIATNAGDFATSSGTVTINSDAGSFTVTPTADTTTEGVETFTVTVSGGGAASVTSSTITINDTSITPAASASATGGNFIAFVFSPGDIPWIEPVEYDFTGSPNAVYNLTYVATPSSGPAPLFYPSSVTMNASGLDGTELEAEFTTYTNYMGSVSITMTNSANPSDTVTISKLYEMSV